MPSLVAVVQFRVHACRIPGCCGAQTLPPGKYAFWKNTPEVVPVNLRETMLDIGGQEIMTADKMTLRVNAVANYGVADTHKVLSAADDGELSNSGDTLGPGESPRKESRQHADGARHLA